MNVAVAMSSGDRDGWNSHAAFSPAPTFFNTARSSNALASQIATAQSSQKKTTAKAALTEAASDIESGESDYSEGEEDDEDEEDDDDEEEEDGDGDNPAAGAMQSSSPDEPFTSPVATPERGDSEHAPLDPEQLLAFFASLEPRTASHQSTAAAASAPIQTQGQNGSQYGSAPSPFGQQQYSAATTPYQAPTPNTQALQGAAVDNAISFLTQILGSNEWAWSGGDEAQHKIADSVQGTAAHAAQSTQQSGSAPLHNYQHLLRDVISRIRPIAALPEHGYPANSHLPEQLPEEEELTWLLQRLMETRQKQAQAQQSRNDQQNQTESQRIQSYNGTPSAAGAPPPHFSDLLFDEDDNEDDDPDFIPPAFDIDQVMRDVMSGANGHDMFTPASIGAPTPSSFFDGSSPLGGPSSMPPRRESPRKAAQAARALQSFSRQSNIMSTEALFSNPNAPSRNDSMAKSSLPNTPYGDPNSPLADHSSMPPPPRNTTSGSSQRQLTAGVLGTAKGGEQKVPRNLKQQRKSAAGSAAKKGEVPATVQDEEAGASNEVDKAAEKREKRKRQKAAWMRKWRAQMAAEGEGEEKSDSRPKRKRTKGPDDDAENDSHQDAQRNGSEERRWTSEEVSPSPSGPRQLPSSSPATQPPLPDPEAAQLRSANALLAAKLELMQRRLKDLQEENDELKAQQMVWTRSQAKS